MAGTVESACAVDFNSKVAQLPFQSIKVRRIAKIASMSQKARLDRPESRSIAKILVRPSTEMCFKILNLGLEFYKRFSNFRPLYTKYYPIP
jgi:hypothetical protein